MVVGFAGNIALGAIIIDDAVCNGFIKSFNYSIWVSKDDSVAL